MNLSTPLGEGQLIKSRHIIVGLPTLRIEMTEIFDTKCIFELFEHEIISSVLKRDKKVRYQEMIEDNFVNYTKVITIPRSIK